MKKFGVGAFLLAGFAIFFFTISPTEVSASGNNSHKDSKLFYCKSGRVAKNPHQCKENGGNR